MYVTQWMRLLASGESLCCAANTSFWPQKTADILNYPQRERATQKENNAYLKEKKDPRSSPCNWQEPISGSCKQPAQKAFPCDFGAKNEERESKTAHKIDGVKERGGGGQKKKKVDLWALQAGRWEGGWERIRRTPPPYGPNP